MPSDSRAAAAAHGYVSRLTDSYGDAREIVVIARVNPELLVRVA
jgi:hypothetical protein